MFCTGVTESESNHFRNQCPVFRELKSRTSKHPYIATELKPTESEGFSAAGILPFRRSSEGEIELLLAREWRKGSDDNGGGDKLNFLGGKRLKKETTALTCAVSKFLSETGGCVPSQTVEELRQGCPLVCWSKHTKYALFVFEFSNEDDFDISCVGVDKEGVKRLEWVKRSSIIDEVWSLENMHSFALNTMHELLDCNVMQHLESVFDIGSKTHSPEIETTNIAIKMKSTYDPIKLLRAVGKHARPDLPSLPKNPKLHELNKIASCIPSDTLDKLRLKLNPDRLSKLIKRSPTEEELRVPLVATSLLNMVLAGDANETEFVKVQNTLKSELNNIASKGDGKTKDTSKDIESLLKELKMSTR